MSTQPPPEADDVGTFRAENVTPATRTPARPATLRAQARAVRSQINRAAHASSQAGRDLRRAAGRLPENNPHRAALLEAAERQEALAAMWEAARPPVPARKPRRP